MVDVHPFRMVDFCQAQGGYPQDIHQVDGSQTQRQEPEFFLPGARVGYHKGKEQHHHICAQAWPTDRQGAVVAQVDYPVGGGDWNISKKCCKVDTQKHQAFQ